MNRTGSLVTGVALAVMLGTGLTAAVPGVGVQTVSAQDPAQETLADQLFRVDFTAEPDGHGTTRITGYVHNADGRAADQVRLRITELDLSGVTLARYVEPMLETVPALGRAYFDVKVPDEGILYRVAVDSWNTVEQGSK
jgi:hypothetical protein